MTRNVGTVDRALRALGALSMGVLAFVLPLPVAVRVPVFAALGAYMLWTSLSGTCLGYRLMGRSTCPAAGR